VHRVCVLLDHSKLRKRVHAYAGAAVPVHVYLSIIDPLRMRMRPGYTIQEIQEIAPPKRQVCTGAACGGQKVTQPAQSAELEHELHTSGGRGDVAAHAHASGKMAPARRRQPNQHYRIPICGIASQRQH